MMEDTARIVESTAGLAKKAGESLSVVLLVINQYLLLIYFQYHH